MPSRATCTRPRKSAARPAPTFACLTRGPAEATAFAKEAGMVAEEQPDFDAALSGAVRGAGTVLVTGSFHTVGDAMSRLQVSPFAA